MDKLVALRKEQALSEKVRNVNYESLIAPFYYRVGDFLANYILLNTDELGTVRPFQEEEEFAEYGAENEALGDQNNAEEVKAEEPAPVEETKVGETEVAPTTMMINTTGTANN